MFFDTIQKIKIIFGNISENYDKNKKKKKIPSRVGGRKNNTYEIIR